MSSPKSSISSAASSKGICANWQHATRLFVDDTYRLSPRTKFLYYVYFDINEVALKSSSWNKQTHGRELGMLVKRSALPKFSLDSVTKNQYNRKKILYKTLKYEPIQLAFHDDSNAVVSSLWALYYGYYVVDRHLQHIDYQYDQYAPDWSQRYGLDNNVGASGEKYPFFNSIQVFTMNINRFVGYTLLNPRITNWTHGDVDYEASDTIESTMSVEYENVIYSSGSVSQGTPQGFAELHYDVIPSPLPVSSDESNTVENKSPTHNAPYESSSSSTDAINAVSDAVNNTNNISVASAHNNTAGMLSFLTTDSAGSAINAVGGVFPRAGNTTVEASPKETLANINTWNSRSTQELQAQRATLWDSRSTRDLQAAAAAAEIPTSNSNSLYPDNDSANAASFINDFNTNGTGE